MTIENQEYTDLIRQSEKLSMILASIYKGCRLNWNKTGIAFDDDVIDIVLTAIDGERRAEVWIQLLEEAEKKEIAERIKAASEVNNAEA